MPFWAVLLCLCLKRKVYFHNLTEFTDTPPAMGWAIFAEADCTQDASGNWVVNTGASPIATPTVTENADGSVTSTYLVPTDVVRNGTGANAGTEAGAFGRCDRAMAVGTAPAGGLWREYCFSLPAMIY